MPTRPGADSATPADEPAAPYEPNAGLVPREPGGSQPRHPRRRKRIVLFSVLGVVVLLVAAVAWVGIRALLAKGELEKAIPLATKVEQNLAGGDSAAAKRASAALTKHAGKAAELTSDPIWRAAEIVPWLGGNLTAVRQAAAVTDAVAEHAVAPLTGVAGNFTVASLKPKNGTVDLGPLAEAAPTLHAAQLALADAKTQAHAIKTGGTIGAVASAVSQLVKGVDTASDVVNAAANATQLLPSMLGADGPRNYLLLIQNPSELRSTGGVSGAMAVLHTDKGHIALGKQASTMDFRKFPSEVMPLPTDTAALYGPRVAQFIQNINLTPRYPLSSELAATMWKKKFGTTIDGVFKIDPVALSYLLKATGPVKLATGDTLSADNAVPLLLSEVYQRYPDPRMQDAFFASVASTVFQKITAGHADASALVAALAKAGGEGRILLWSGHPAEQKVLAGTTLAGGLPVSTSSTSQYGVYLNDSTGSKMDYYLKVSVGVASRVCRADGHPNTRVSVTLTNTAPTDAGTALPAYVAGPVPDTVKPGHIRNKVAIYAPAGSLVLSTTSGGADFAANATVDEGHTVGQFEVELAPGESKTVTMDLLETKSTTTRADAVVTPALSTSVKHMVAPKCSGSVN
jgi:hypothetical protein